ncbi:MAG: amino acid adenylation domain-containing protein [Acidobacteria bacterium]|nr:amino acid adenylation domain-containing protein [Acidobacteriota bacterium]
MADSGEPFEVLHPAPVEPQQGAYLLFTSGSTGRPKGVLNTHGALRNRLLWMQETFALEPGERVFHKTPATFDVSLWELLWPFLVGGCLVVAPAGAHGDATLLARWVEEHRIAVVHFVPSLLVTWLDEPPVARCRALRWVIASGEELRRDVADRCRARLPPGARLANLYGPTEAAIDVTAHLPRPEAGSPPVPIGRPIANLTARLSGSWGEELAHGARGEILLGGAGLARGYRGDPRRTALCFVPDPDGGEPGARRYRTGDLGYRRGDGALVFLRRRDRQVQLRGLRVEPGEIEAVLRSHPAVAEAVVVLRTRPAAVAEPGGPMPRVGARRFSATRPASLSLDAYVSGAGSSPLLEELRAHLRAHLPESLVPATLTILETWPRTASGKLDRSALPPPRRRAAARPRGGVAAPRSAPERAVVAVWQEVLELDDIGVDDDFFALGGDSILSLRVRAALERHGWRMDLGDLYRERDARRLATRLEPLAQRDPDPGAATDARCPGPFELVDAADRERLPAGVEAAYPLGATQAGVLFHAQFEPRSTLYRHALLWRISGRLTRPVLDRAVEAVIERHEMLRTAFDLARFSRPLQLVLSRVPRCLEVVDLRQLTAEARGAAIERWVAEAQARPLDLSSPPLVGFAWLRLEHEESVLALTFVDALLDGWSAASLAGEVLECADCWLGGEAPPSRPRPRPFRAYVAREAEAAQDPRAAEFWARALAGSRAQRLPRWSGGAEEGSEVLDHAVEPRQVERLETLARHAGAALKHVLLAVHGLVLARLSGRDDVVLAVETNGRTSDPGAEATLGMHVNLLPLRLAVGRSTPRELVLEARRLETEALAWRRFPFSAIQRLWGKEGLADTVFNYTHFHVAGRLSDLRHLRLVEVTGVDRGSFALRVDFNRQPATAALGLTLSGDRRRLGPVALEQLRRTYAAALELFSGDPDARLDGWNPWTLAQRHQLVVESQGPPPEPPLPVHQRIASSAARSPAAVAVVAAGESWTYHRLRAETLALAARLRAVGVGLGDVVAVAVKREVHLPASLLAVLEVGAAYLPLDPTHPPGRLAAMLTDAAVGVVIADPGWLSPALTSGLVLIEPRGGPGWQGPQGGETVPPLELPLSSPAYVLYTSGSAGAPKGVVVPHGALANLVSTLVDLLRLDPHSRSLAITTLAFDISALEIFAPLVAGARLEIASDREIGDGDALAEHLRRIDLDWLQATPSTWRVLGLAGFEGRRGLTALSGGESLPPDLAHELRRAGNRLWNLYGPTETTVWSTAHRVGEEDGPVSIGRALAGTRLYVVDTAGRPLGSGIAGELWIGGVGVACGYLGRAGLTAERFAPDPFTDEPGGRVYRSGDLAEWSCDGRLRFLGRVDRQLKLRGHRIEPDEISAALEGHESVGRAVVVARGGGGAVDELVAFVQPAGEAEPSPALLRQYLYERLPRFMVPRRLVVVASLPVSANGKVDLSRLPMPAARRPTAEQLETLLRRVEGLSEDEARAALGPSQDSET